MNFELGKTNTKVSISKHEQKFIQNHRHKKSHSHSNITIQYFVSKNIIVLLKFKMPNQKRNAQVTQIYINSIDIYEFGCFFFWSKSRNFFE